MHNASHDLLWLWESGFKYDGAVFDTMLAEYVLQRGIKEPLSLENMCRDMSVETQKQDSLKEHLAKGGTTYNMDHGLLDKYLSADLHATQQLADKLWARLNTQKDAGLMGTVDLTNEVCVCLARIYQRGFKVDRTALEEVKREYETERNELVSSLQDMFKIDG